MELVVRVADVPEAKLKRLKLEGMIDEIKARATIERAKEA